MESIQAGEQVKFTDAAVDAYLKTGDDATGVYKVVTATDTHLGLEFVGGPPRIPGVSLTHVSAKRETVERA